MNKYWVTASQNWYPDHACDLTGARSDDWHEIVEAESEAEVYKQMGGQEQETRLGGITLAAELMCEKCGAPFDSLGGCRCEK